MYSEKELIKSLKKSKEEAFEYVIDTYGNKLFKTCYLILNNKEEAEDVVQETFLKVFKEIKSFKEKSSLYTWIYRIAINLSKDSLKKKSDFIEYEDFIESSVVLEEEVFEKIDNSILKEKVFSLNHIYKEIIVLFYFEELSIKEICEILQEKEGTIKSRLNRARNILKESIVKEDF